MSIEIDGQIRSSGTQISEWQRCIMWGKRYSISGDLISGFGFMRTIKNWEDPDEIGYVYGKTEQFAKNKKEILT